MDKKNTAIGIALFAGAIGLFVLKTNQDAKYAAAHPAPPVTESAQVASPTPGAAGTPAVTGKLAPVIATPATPEQILKLDNGTIDVAITTNGGAIRSVALLKHASEIGKDSKTSPVVFNDTDVRRLPALALSFADPVTGKPVAWLAGFSVKEKTDTQVVLEAKRADGLVVTRDYEFLPGKTRDEHLLHCTTTFRREGGVTAPVVTSLNLGALPPVEADRGQRYLNVSAFDGEGYHTIGIDKFKESKGMLGFGAHAAVPDVALDRDPANPIHWVAASNQFFAGIATFDAKSRAFATGLFAYPIHLGKAADGTENLTVTAEAGLNLGNLAPGESKTVSFDYYVGPKEYARLADLGDSQDKVVQFMKLFGFISVEWLCKLLMTALTGLHWLLVSAWASNTWNWGIAIILLTVIVKGATWPLTGMQLKASENMKKLQKPMAALKEKYKDNPQKLQQETMGLYKEHRVNPLAGCLPVLIQIPIFTGLYYAFQTCAELRHQPFLWFPDLSVADTIPHLPAYIHVLPILMGLSSLVNMRMTPMAPSTDSNQKFMMYGMMVFFPVICYSMPAGLTTYYTVSNLLTLVQSSLIRRKQAARAAAEATGTIEVIAPVSKKSKNGKKKKA